MIRVQETSSDGALLPIAAVIVRIIAILLWVALAAIAIGIPAVLINAPEVLSGLAEEGVTGDPATLITRLVGLMLGAAVLIGLGIAFFTLLHRIAHTVQLGDPFIPENAMRLRRMAWIFLAMEGMSFALGTLIRLALPMAEGRQDISVTSLVAVLALFVLARVFALGTQMRAEIEGTV